MNYIPSGEAPTKTTPPRNVCDFCDRPVVVCISTKGKGHWGAWMNQGGRILGYFHSSCMKASGHDDTEGAV